jgi:hypothetical protein
VPAALMGTMQLRGSPRQLHRAAAREYTQQIRNLGRPALNGQLRREYSTNTCSKYLPNTRNTEKWPPHSLALARCTPRCTSFNMFRIQRRKRRASCTSAERSHWPMMTILNNGTQASRGKTNIKNVERIVAVIMMAINKLSAAESKKVMPIINKVLVTPKLRMPI